MEGLLVIFMIVVAVGLYGLYERALNAERELGRHNLSCKRCGSKGSTEPFKGIPENPDFYKEPINLCSACRSAQEKWIWHRFMLSIEGRLDFGRADLVAMARKDWGDKAVDVLALLSVAREDMDLARRVLDEESFSRIRPWIEENVGAPASPLGEAKQGEAAAQYVPGVAYYDGQGVPQDDIEAVESLLEEAEQGLAWAQYSLGMIYAKGQGAPQDYTEASKWFRLAAEQGFAEAQHNLGTMYYQGWGVLRDAAEAVKWFRLAAEQGDALAQAKLGNIYYEGQGAPQDYTEASKWFRLAAEQGLAAAQRALGIAYAYGRGAPQDDTEAVKWYRLAAEQGFAEAQHNLGQMLAEGRGVPQDFVQAHMWANLAASEKSGAEAKSFGELRDAVADVMTPQQIAEAQRLAREWTPKTWDKLKGLLDESR